MINNGEDTSKDNFTPGTTVNNPITPPDRSVRGTFDVLSQNPLARFAGLMIEYHYLDEPESDIQVRICRYCETQLEINHIGYRYIVCPSRICFYLRFENHNIRVLANHLKQELTDILGNCPINIYYSDEVKSIHEAEQQLDYLKQHMQYSQIYGYDRLFAYQDIYNAETGQDYPFHEKSLIIEEKLFRKNYNELTQCLEELCFQIMNPDSRQKEFLYSYHSLYLFMETVLYLFKFHFREKVWDSPLNSLTLPELLEKYSGLYKSLCFLNTCITEYQAECETHSTEQRRRSMAKFQQYIEQNLATVTLNSLAEHFHITPAYLSRTFKRDMGQNFSQYLSDLKLQKAALLLEQGYRINEISKELGYASPAYFLSKFKEKYSMTPSVYRKKLQLYKAGISDSFTD